MHFGDCILYLRSVRHTRPSLMVLIDGAVYYGDMTSDAGCGRLRIEYDGVVYSVCNMDIDN